MRNVKRLYVKNSANKKAFLKIFESWDRRRVVELPPDQLVACQRNPDPLCRELRYFDFARYTCVFFPAKAELQYTDTGLADIAGTVRIRYTVSKSNWFEENYSTYLRRLSTYWT